MRAGAESNRQSSGYEPDVLPLRPPCKNIIRQLRLVGREVRYRFPPTDGVRLSKAREHSAATSQQSGRARCAFNTKGQESRYDDA